MDSKALTKIQTAALVAIIVVGAVGGSIAYMFWSSPASSTENIRIGVCADLDMSNGMAAWQGAVLAAEQINAQGGVLGRNITIVAEDDDDETPPYDVAIASNAITKLITVDNADYIISGASSSNIFYAHQDICAEHKVIMFGLRGVRDEFTQRVIDDYERYKYFFKFYMHNGTTTMAAWLGDLLTVGKITGFTKVALIGLDSSSVRPGLEALLSSLPAHGFEVVYNSLVENAVTDYSSYFAAIEATGAEILFPVGLQGAPFVKEWYDRQSPCVIWGNLQGSQESDFWELTEGKCEYISFSSSPVFGGYPLTNKTLPTREAYIERWGTVPKSAGFGAYDGVRFILLDAIRRAGTFETETVIKALETTNVETSAARHFIFTSSHDIMVGTGGPNNPEEDYLLIMYFQFQENGTLVPVKPEAIMKEVGATYKYPPWQGPWTK